MATRDSFRNLQQVGLYLAAAGSLGFSMFAELLLFYSPPGSDDSPLTRISTTWQIWLIGVALFLLVAATLVTLLRPRTGAAAALVASAVGLAYSLVRLCPAAVTLTLFVLWPLPFMTFILPAVLLSFVVVYSLDVIRAGSEARTVVQWLGGNPALGCLVAGPLVLAFVVAVCYVVLQVALARPAAEVHAMSWQDSSNTRCSHEVTLKFADAPGYRISTCSAELLGYLRSTASEEVQVEFERTFSWGAWNYRVVQVGAWRGDVHLDGLQLVQWCSGSDCTGGATGPPLLQPYMLR